ncbi:DUF6415 family natural product biosynthesis protein [Streptomyces sp. NPDC058000]|uniref:DUF6415 family natural product biosynthesis protein n=1 Tax=Streptomyces sp. NPDC058000 TaxID=3346299 RepID=UPI0036E7795B
MATTPIPTASSLPTAGAGPGTQLQADIAAALRTRTTLPPYDEVLRLIDTLKGHLAPLVEKAKEHVSAQHQAGGAWSQAIAGAEFQLRADPGNGLVSATHRLQGLARCALHIDRHLNRDAAGGSQ